MTSETDNHSKHTMNDEAKITIIPPGGYPRAQPEQADTAGDLFLRLPAPQPEMKTRIAPPPRRSNPKPPHRPRPASAGRGKGGNKGKPPRRGCSWFSLMIAFLFVILLFLAGFGGAWFSQRLQPQEPTQTPTMPPITPNYITATPLPMFEGTIIEPYFPRSGTKATITLPPNRRSHAWTLHVTDNIWLHIAMKTTITNHTGNPLELRVAVDGGTNAPEIDLSRDFNLQRDSANNIHEYILRGGHAYIVTITYIGNQTGDVAFDFENNQRAINCIMLVDTLGGAGTDVLQSPQSGSTIIQKIQDGMPASVIGRVNQWYRINLPTRGLDGVGYIHADALARSPEMPGVEHYEDCDHFFGID